MGEYARLITKSSNKIDIEQLKNSLEQDMEIEVVGSSNEVWEKLILKRNDYNQIIAEIIEVKNIEEEKQELIKGLDGSKPENGAEWVKEYIKNSNKIYRFELFEGVEDQYGWYSFEAVREAVWECCGGIMQNDGEGYRNEEGFFIVWQFEYEVEGPYEAAVLNRDGSWSCFEMELSNEEHIKEFKAGKVPNGLEILEF